MFLFTGLCSQLEPEGAAGQDAEPPVAGESTQSDRLPEHTLCTSAQTEKKWHESVYPFSSKVCQIFTQIPQIVVYTVSSYPINT